jgi:uncharacterized alpha-E superfamily protein
MEWQTLINIGAGSVLAVIGWFARELWEAVNAMKKDLHRLEVKIAKDYATHQDLNARYDKIEMILGKIFDKLDNKVDK